MRLLKRTRARTRNDEGLSSVLSPRTSGGSAAAELDVFEHISALATLPSVALSKKKKRAPAFCWHNRQRIAVVVGPRC